MRMPESACLLADLVAVPSPTGQEQDAARLLVDRMTRFGWESAHLDGMGSVIAYKGKGDKELVLMSHIDTVPGGPKFLINDEIIRGRGSVDAKGPCCAMAVAGGSVQVSADWRITFVGAVGEEIDSRGARFRLPLHEPTAVIVGEPTGSDAVALSYRGRVLFSFASEDEGAHRSGNPGPMTAVIRAASSMCDIVSSMGPNYTIAVMEMSGSEHGTRSGKAIMDFRFPLGTEKDDVELRLNETAAAFGVELNIIEYVPPFGIHKSDPLIRAFRNAIRENGDKPKLLAKQGTCDLNVIAPWGCKMCAYGPGDSKYDHTSYEQTKIAEYLNGIEVLKLALPKVMEEIK